MKREKRDEPPRWAAGIPRHNVRPLSFAAFAALCWLVSLVGCSSSNSGTSTSNTAGGPGKNAFVAVQNDRFAVTTIDLGAIDMDNQRYARWSFGLKLRQAIQLRSIRIEDVTEGTPVVLINDQAPQVVDGAWSSYSGAIESNASALPWLFDNTPSKRTFRFTITDLNGQTSVLDQPISYTLKAKKELIKWYSFSA